MRTIAFLTDASWQGAPIRTGSLARVFMLLGVACGVPAGIAYAYKFGGALEFSPVYYVIEFGAIFAAIFAGLNDKRSSRYGILNGLLKLISKSYLSQ